MQYTKQTAYIIFALAFLFSSCSKEGPQGPTGPQGEQGVAGDQGPKGDNGAPGNSNVKVYTKDISSATWIKIGNKTSGYLELDISTPEVLTSDVVNNWVNLVYIQSTDFIGWTLLPYYTERNIQASAAITIGHLTLLRAQDGKPETQSNFYNVKLVCIKPSSSGSLERHQTPPPNFKDYHSVCRYYGITEPN